MQSAKQLKKTKRKDKLKKQKANTKSLKRKAHNKKEKKAERETMLLEKEVQRIQNRHATYRKPKESGE